ncbi:MAG: hypothetical protein JNJ54_31275 [Myxococcaceae bacterium]|nr:hypothetical protein [Myxococcaceae bacterium]
MFMEARRTLPDEAFVPARIVLENKAFDQLVKSMEKAPKPTRALVELMRGK